MYLRKIGAQILERADDLSTIWSSEVGVVKPLSMMMIKSIANVFDFHAELAASFAFEERMHPVAGGALGLLVREPVGVVLAIIPWNAPFGLLAHKLAPALLAGCAVIAKASPEAPGTIHVMAQIAETVGLPPGVFNFLTAERDVSERLVRHPDIDKVAFTGSSIAGRKIASICGGRMARATLELGGKSAAVVLDDYDIEAAADGLAQPACRMTGQVCSALSRVIVSQDRHDQMVEALAARFSDVRVGDPFTTGVQMGPLAMRRQRDRIEHLFAKGKQEGARLISGGSRPAHLNRGFFIEPTVFGNVDNASTLAREEIFGPVLTVIPAANEAEAIKLANDTPYGLNNSVFTHDSSRALEIARKLRSGTVGHNAFRTDFSIAFGGFKQSGIGREGGIEGLRPYLEVKAIILDGIPSGYQPR